MKKKIPLSLASQTTEHGFCAKKNHEAKKQPQQLIYFEVYERLDLYIPHNAWLISMALSNLERTNVGFGTNSIRTLYMKLQPQLMKLGY